MLAEPVVISCTHRLLPLAHRLWAEGVKPRVYVQRDHYRRAYAGILDIEAKPWGGDLGPLAGRTVLTDCLETTAALARVEGLTVFGRVGSSGRETSPLALCAWLHDGALAGIHWGITELGSHAGGTGLPVPSSVTITAVHQSRVEDLTKAMQAQLGSGHHNGLVRIEVRQLQPQIEFGVQRWGWPDLHHQLLFSQQDSAAGAIENWPQAPVDRVLFGTVISVPPWPYPATRSARRYDVAPTMPAPLRRHCLFHDVQLARAGLTSTGLDGWLALGVAQSRFLATARQLVFGAAQGLGIKAVHVRPDAGTLSESILTALELQQLI